MQTPSLLPYLQGTDSNLYLDLRSSLIGGEFCPDYRSNILSAGYKVDLRSNGGSLIRKADLIIQPDVLPVVGNITGSQTNTDIDNAWRNAYRGHAHKKDGKCFFLKEQVDDADRFVQFAPLLYCTRRTIFFSPLCKKCLNPLQLCRDDALLQKNGLPLYSKSLSRYLYCPSCTDQTDSPWYVKVREAEDRKQVGDERQLLADMGEVSLSAQSGTGLPCCDCPYQEQCFGETLGVEQAVVIFSFYPFYAMLLEDTDCSGADFLTRISGATVEQALNQDRERFGNTKKPTASILPSIPPEAGFFLPCDNSAHFTEVLYLKVLFLFEVANLLFSFEEPVSLAGGYLSPADLRIRFDPFASFQQFWSFSVVFPGFCRPDILEEGPKAPEATLCYAFGMFWFAVLGVNSEQRESEIYRKLGLLYAEGGRSEISLHQLLELLPPVKVVWMPGSCQVDGEGEANYRLVLELGRDILLSAYTGQETDGAGICSRIEKCLYALRRQVVSGMKTVSGSRFLAEDRVIFEVVEGLKRKWRDETQNMPPKSAAEPLPCANEFTVGTTQESDDFTTGDDFHSETVVLTSDNLPVNDRDIHHDETIIIQAEPVQEEKPGKIDPLSIESSPLIAKLEETVRLKPEPQAKVESTLTEEKKHEPHLEETVVLGDGKILKPNDNVTEEAASPESHKQQHIDPSDEKDFMTETVVLKPRKDGGSS